MIRKVPDLQAWVLKKEDFPIAANIINPSGWCMWLELPVLDTILDHHFYSHYSEIPDNSYFCIISTKEIDDWPFWKITLNKLEEINKTWNKFYD